MLTPENLHEYQRQCVDHMLQHNDSMLWLQMGLGKTPITLTTIVKRMEMGTVKKVFIFGPLRVITTVWEREARKWSHTQHLRFSVVHGDERKRLRALFTDADIYLSNYEQMNWIAETLDHYYLSQKKLLPFQMVVYDEVSKLKNSTSLRMGGGNRDRVIDGEDTKVHFTGWRKILPYFMFRTGLTGTPASNGYIDLHGQYLAVDGGKRLNTHITHYRNDFFMRDYSGFGYDPTALGQAEIERRISDITVKMDAKDYLDMPEVTVTDMFVQLPKSVMKKYKELEKEMFVELDGGGEVEVFNKASLSLKCLQIANGSPYIGESLQWESVHDKKLKALEEVLEEAAGQPVLCSYSFKSDAMRIMQKFKKLKPVNLTETPANQTEKIINKWNRGEIKLLIGHPACLHPSTEVLTEWRGWVKIIDVRDDERVFDGVEFVSHRGCSYSGYKDVIDVFGITMTPNHKLLIEDEWVEAADVRDSKEVREKALYKYEGDDPRVSKVFEMSDGVGNHPSECSETQSNGTRVLSTLCAGSLSQYDGHENTPNMVGTEASIKRHDRSELWRSWYHHVRRVEGFFKLLSRHARKLFRQSDNRASGCEQTPLQRELHMGDDVRTTGQQADKSSRGVSRRAYTPCRVGAPVGFQQDNVTNATKQGYDRKRGCTGRDDITLRKEHVKGERETPTNQKEHVYDLVDCGPRHRFLVRNGEGGVFISHNSMGHGVDGLQDSGSILVWFGLNWSLELYEQMIGRLNRQGQTKTVSIIRILCEDTVDLAVSEALATKNDNQEGLKAALDRYRGKTVAQIDKPVLQLPTLPTTLVTSFL